MSTARSSAVSSRPGHRVTGNRRQRAKGKAGWQHLFVAIDDYSRLGFARVYPDESADSALAFLDELVRFYGAHGITVERVLSDNGTCFKRRWADACAVFGITVKKTRAYRPRPTARPNASSAPCSSAGRTPIPTSTRPSGWLPCLEHSTSTIASAPTALSEALRRYSASTTSLGHTPSSAVSARTAPLRKVSQDQRSLFRNY